MVLSPIRVNFRPTKKNARKLLFHQNRDNEINTPIQFINDNLTFLQQGFNELIENLNDLSKVDLDFLKEELPLAFKDSKDGLSHIAKIVSSLKDFSHPGNQTRQLYNVKKLLESCLSLTKGEWKNVADVKINISNNVELNLYPSELTQVFINMIINSVHSPESVKLFKYKRRLVKAPNF